MGLSKHGERGLNHGYFKRENHDKETVISNFGVFGYIFSDTCPPADEHGYKNFMHIYI